MSNLAGKAYAMNLVTPLHKWLAPVSRAAFWAAGRWPVNQTLAGLKTLSMIHYARWVVVKASDFPRLSPEQPEEDTHYDYQFFFSNFNGSWAQYVDSFSAAIPSGLNLLWFKNVGWPKSKPETTFHTYVQHNQVFTNHYYSAYPLAASNDVKAGARVRKRLIDFSETYRYMPADQFAVQYKRMLKELDADLGTMEATPVVSTAAAAAERARSTA